MLVFNKKRILLVVLAMVLSLVQVSFAANGDHAIVVGGSDTTYPATADGVILATKHIADGGTITLESDIEADSSVLITGQGYGNPSKSFIIDGDGHTIKAAYDNVLIDLYKSNYKRGLIALYEGVNVELKNLNIDAKKLSGSSFEGTVFGIKSYMAGDVTLRNVTIKNAKKFFPIPNSHNEYKDRDGGFGIESSTTNLVLDNVNYENCEEGAIDFEITSSDVPKKSDLTIDGRVTGIPVGYDVPDAELGITNKNHAVIRADIKPNMTLREITPVGTKVYTIGEYVKGDIVGTYGTMSNAVIHPNTDESEVDDELWNSYYPKTLDTYYYRVVYNEIVYGINKITSSVALLPKLVKIRGENLFEVVEDTKYKWSLKREGLVGNHDIPTYTVTVTPMTDTETDRYILGSVKVKNYKPYPVSGVKVRFESKAMPSVNKTVDNLTFEAGQEKYVYVKIPINNLTDSQITEVMDFYMKATLVAGTDGDRTVNVPIKSKMVQNDVDKVVNVINSENESITAFQATWNEELTSTVYTYEGVDVNIKPITWSKLCLDRCTITKLAQTNLSPLEKVNVRFTTTMGSLTGSTSFLANKDFPLGTQSINPPIVNAPSAYYFVGWDPRYDENIKVSNNVEYKALFAPVISGGGTDSGSTGSAGASTGSIVIVEEERPLGELEKNDHFAYIQGYPDGSVRPNGLLTREEVATIFYRLLENDYRNGIKSQSNPYIDVENTRWSNRYISTLSKGKIFVGFPDKSFRPKDKIKRSELAKLGSRFEQLSDKKGSKFTDISGHWSEEYIVSAYNKGWLDWVEGNRFEPEKYVTRAEFIAFVNNILERHVLVQNILPGARKFTDLNDKSAWYYAPMSIATNSYEYEEIDEDLNKEEFGDVLTPLGSMYEYQKWTKIIYPNLDM